MADEKDTKLSSKLEKIAKDIEELSVLELSELVTALQDRLGVSATPIISGAPVAASGAAPAEAAADSGAGAASQTVVLTDAGTNKIGVIKALREINPNLGLKEAKDMTEKLPAEVLKDAKAEDAKVAIDKLQAAGAKIEVK
ncbi:MAG: 50S ribosomal protein L7/L12 [Candidatus Blackburnbacteria bacterium RIFCSPHIGHO2_02_FULL_39_13]|uniref:Large ribosomal subunit protein bL12 n=1 Tax=Candidatus Blackburnbacteria bacterium RIFCSPLOWO2_01_FULL_40_20 TaxID=1797519 RepID=A0A1G1VBE6_9BACT|nr:MAG: 50S ribosomal protein L7/L12 [Candidatus Blackburnbacteria bacterium RIFCSPHIGHO2_01_FULL_40_17]OGY08906.1 MAG: 50S ribosomal protein L7/L12 [Candidatus Blackburnbacteria bacterium RIFCSPHIGHO2_02_FULL_39_13]OGY12748.1 MAG: 50S ribosomal protein L7/L12 [Candidatus Blackburnbacteria bacterium RIFCSPLOWO2_01_FULL_40_20]OGY15272.1 MAG: 50S ribosomal protein L7/L12 [Candidatus Blackburnbacteria bacterium RIFCSPLOWO2_02_FULL_40_10]HBL51879.1 50S ribosomal protein L7/L12 [Candidatus Blackburn